ALPPCSGGCGGCRAVPPQRRRRLRGGGGTAPPLRCRRTRQANECLCSWGRLSREHREGGEFCRHWRWCGLPLLRVELDAGRSPDRRPSWNGLRCARWAGRSVGRRRELRRPCSGAVAGCFELGQDGVVAAEVEVEEVGALG